MRKNVKCRGPTLHFIQPCSEVCATVRFKVSLTFRTHKCTIEGSTLNCQQNSYFRMCETIFCTSSRQGGK